MQGAEHVLRSLARAGAERGDLVVAVGGGVVGDLAGFCAARLPARHAPRSGADDAGGAGRLGLRRQDRRGPAGGQELRGRLPPAGGGALRSGRARHAAAGGGRGRLRRGGQDRADRRRVALGARAPGRRARRARDHGLPADEARGGGRGRARRRAPPGAEPRPHRRPRDRGGHRLRALPPRRGGGHRPAGGAAPVGTRGAARRGGRPAGGARAAARVLRGRRWTRCWRSSSATRSARAGGCRSCWSRRPAR